MSLTQQMRARGHGSWVRAALLAVGLSSELFLPTPAPAQIRPVAPPVAAKPTPEAERVAAELGVGSWIWTTNFADKQLCRVWRAFTLPATNHVQQAIVRITADNLYRLYVDGREVGEGGNWRSLTEYDITWLLDPGDHVLAVEALNDSLEGGILLGMRIQFANGEEMRILSDASWRVVPNDAPRWAKRTRAESDWPAATPVGVLGQAPWWLWPVSIIATPPLQPVQFHFWQTGWFLAIVLSVCGSALALSLWLATRLAVQTRAQQLLARERALIARDIHDDLGAGLTQLVLQGEVAQTVFPQGSAARTQLDQLCERARLVSHALDEIVWAVNSKRDTLRDFTSHVCKYAQNFLKTTPIRCRLDVQPNMAASGFDLPVRRGLFLAVKEALNNAAKHSEASELFLHIYRERDKVVAVVEDNGKGFDATMLGGERNGLTNMQQRLLEMGGECRLFSFPGAGCRVEFKMPLVHPGRAGAQWWRRLFRRHPRPGVASAE